MTHHGIFMAEALSEARRALEEGEIPVGAVLVRDGKIIARGRNTREGSGDPLGHAEIMALREGSRVLGGWRLTGCTLYVTLEPCAMCAGAALNARVDRVVYGAADPAAGCLGSRINLFALELGAEPRIVAGVMEEECARLLRDFFRERRKASERPGMAGWTADGSQG